MRTIMIFSLLCVLAACGDGAGGPSVGSSAASLGAATKDMGKAYGKAAGAVISGDTASMANANADLLRASSKMLSGDDKKQFERAARMNDAAADAIRAVESDDLDGMMKASGKMLNNMPTFE